MSAPPNSDAGFPLPESDQDAQDIQDSHESNSYPVHPAKHPRPTIRNSTKATFAHPIEAEFARILDFYHVRWEYEPRTFPLEWGADGSATLCFTPDFYLPDQDLFVELTTLNPRLMHRKNRKLRKFREMYPELRVKLFSLRDVRTLMLKYRGLSAARGEPESDA
jgi:hypothetical protein